MDPYLNGYNGSENGFGSYDISGYDGSEMEMGLGLADFGKMDAGGESLNFLNDIVVSPYGGDSVSQYLDFSPHGESSSSSEGDSSDPVLKFINQMLMEEDMGEKPWMLHDSLALTVAERSLYDVLGEKYPSMRRSSILVDSPDGSSSHSHGFSETSSSGGSTVNGATFGLESHNPSEAWQHQSSSLLKMSPPAGEVLETLNFGLSSNFAMNGFNGSANVLPGSNSSINVFDKSVNGHVSSNSFLNSFNMNVTGLGNSYSSLNEFDKTVDGLVSNSSTLNGVNKTTVDPLVSNSSFLNGVDKGVTGLAAGPVNSFRASDLFNNSEYILQFRRGVEEASRFLPKTTNLVIDSGKVLDQSQVDPLVTSVTVMNDGYKDSAGSSLAATSLAEKDRKEKLVGRSRGRKRNDVDLQDERINKQSASAVDVDEEELSAMFDSVLLHCQVEEEPPDCDGSEPTSNEKNKQSKGGHLGSSKESSREKKQGGAADSVDLRTLLVLCAQAVSSDDWRTANELLKQIRQHASPNGDGSQRLAHCFANGLEARMAGTGNQIYTNTFLKRTTAADVLKAYQVYLNAIPFKKISMFFANQMILQAASKAHTLHIVDFGILYGFQWPILIQCLSKREGGPPKLRITGIDLPQPGFRPAERVEETGRRLEKYCKRFGVPFEYYAIAQKWDTIKIEDLNIKRNEVLAVNSMFRFKNLLDETVEVNSPRNAVLKLIREMHPNIFTHGIVNGAYNAPFFVTRFREALFYYSALFDVFDATIPRVSEEKLMFEQELYGKDAINVIACEGIERVERPETYKQWQVRGTRAGFKQLPLDKEVMTKLRSKMEACYHKDFVIDEDNCWMLLGWKGRIVFASTCWIPA